MRVLVLPCLCLSVLLAACGQSGPLVLPDDPPPVSAPAGAPAPEAAPEDDEKDRP